MQYAVYFLGLLITASAQAYDDCYDYECQRQRSARMGEQMRLETEAREREYESYAERTKPIQVITPNSSYLAYPSRDGKTISVYGGIGRGFDRE